MEYVGITHSWLKDVLEGQRIHHHLRKLPPYSPHLNAIEHCFHLWKNQIKTTYQTHTHVPLMQQIEQAASLITPQYVSDCTNHIYQFYTLCLEKKPLEEFKPIPKRKRKKRAEQKDNTDEKTEGS